MSAPRGPIALLHGATSSSKAWNTVLPTLNRRYDVFVPTLAGHLGGPELTVAPRHIVDGIVDSMCRQLDDAGIHVTRRTVAKYREDLRIPSTHQRRVKA